MEIRISFSGLSKDNENIYDAATWDPTTKFYFL
jgi:hypothetical protein